MKKIFLSVMCLAGLASMSFTNNNSNKIVTNKSETFLGLKKSFKLDDSKNLDGVLVVGTSATAYPGVLSNHDNKTNDKMNNVINKY